MTTTLSELENIHFDVTSYTVHTQFYQLWTVFARFDRHILPIIHCLLSAKHILIYTAVLGRIHELVQ